MKNWFVISLSVLLFWGVSMPLSAQPTAIDAYQKSDPFLQMVIKQAPAVFLQEKGGPASAEKIRLIIQADESSLQDIHALGADIHTSVAGFHTIQIQKGKLGHLASVGGLQKMFLGQPVVPTDAQAIQHVNAHLVHQGAEGLPRSYSGKDVVIGVIDTGVDFFHEDFRDPQDPSKSRIAYIWDQKMEDGAGESPKKFQYGREWTRTDIEAELSTSPAQLVTHLDTHKIWGGHGTHVMGVAGGNKGLAPGADLIMVASSLSTGDIVDGVRYINHNGQGRRDGQTLCDQYEFWGRTKPPRWFRYFKRYPG
jgi:subtilisin family serine protease